MSLFHLIAPSGYCIKQHAALYGIHCLTDEGHQVSSVEIIAHRCERFAGTEAERLEDLNSPVRLTTPNTVVLVVRGGYGVSHLLADIDWQALVARQQHDPLLTYGHSDLTAIRCGLLAQGNAITFSDPMLVTNFDTGELNAFTECHFQLALCNRTFTIEQQGKDPTCQTEGMLWGGNLAVLISLISTLWISKTENGILVLEDISERLLHIKRMLLQLYRAGILPRQKAIILDSSSGSTPNDYDAGCNLEPVCAFLHSHPPIPFITGLDFGHEQRAATLPLGAHAVLNNTWGGTQLTINSHPVLRMQKSRASGLSKTLPLPLIWQGLHKGQRDQE